ncbi:MAG TPA: hypothetical protein PLK90_04275 [Clostridiales bacterium]|nr:hypothetical protein [Clostridiales bacterium]HQP69598.1 hypothetical protein [Clostridiales bacterium]
MKNLLIILVLAILTAVIAEDCAKYKKQIDSMMVEFNSVKNKMCDPGIDRNRYDDLNSIYTETWQEIVEVQRIQKKCLESQKKTVKVKVEPNRVNSALPELMKVKWSSSRIKVKEALRNRKDLKYVETEDGILEYHNGTYLGYNAERWQFSFAEKKLYACQIVLKNDPKLSVFKLYDKVNADLAKLYGKPAYEKNKFPSSYKSDSIKLTALKNGSVPFYSKWLFKNDDMIRIGVNENGNVMITYLVEKLYKKAK